MKAELVLIKKFQIKKVICFGTGSTSAELTNNIPLKIAYYVDNNSNKWNQEFMGLPVDNPEILLKENKEQIAIIVASMFYAEIAVQLEKMGFVANVHFWNGYELFYNLIFSQGQEIILDYPVNSVPRYGYGKPPHQKLYSIINAGRDRYTKNLRQFSALKDYLQKISYQPSETAYEPFWNNGSMPGLDALSIYGFLKHYNPQKFLEIGSGNSTKFARRSVRDHQLKTQIISIDPEPRAEVDEICDSIIREPLENIDLLVFQELNEGDMLFVDNSHRSFMNSDVTVVFLDILPYLKKGVLVGFHDIFLPFDYLPSWSNRYYSEQYLLASYLLAEGNKFEIELPNMFISNDTVLMEELALLGKDPHLSQVPWGGGAFWIKMK